MLQVTLLPEGADYKDALRCNTNIIVHVSYLQDMCRTREEISEMEYRFSYPNEWGREIVHLRKLNFQLQADIKANIVAKKESDEEIESLRKEIFHLEVQIQFNLENTAQSC